MATNFQSIPLIYISALVEKWGEPDMAQDPGVCEVVRQLDQACREVGFFYVKGHGIPEALMTEVKELTREFYHLPLEEKMKINLTPAAGYRGYQKLRKNHTKGVADMHEAIDCHKEVKPGMYGPLGKILEGSNQWPEHPQNFKDRFEEYFRLCTDLSGKIMHAIALALGVSIDKLNEIAGDSWWGVRILGYPPVSTADVRHGDELGIGAHTDYGLVTLVNQDDGITALQMRNLSGEWINAPPIPGTFTCNIGDMLKVWSNGLYESTVHRVVNNNPKYRVSIAYFYEPNFDVAVEPLDACKGKTGGGSKFSKSVYGEYLTKRVQTNFL